MTSAPSGSVLESHDQSQSRPFSRGAHLLYHAARWVRRQSAFHTTAHLERTTDETRYRRWRYGELQQQIVRNFDVSRIRRRDVLDFGCGTAELCNVLSDYDPENLVAVDMSARAIATASESVHGENPSGRCRPTFICAEQHDRIPIRSDSIDLVCCFDVLEHIPDVSAVAREWWRILRPEGRVWIWWSPWRGPYGHHLESLIPLPWVHLLFSERTLFAACAALYDHPDFVPRKWDRDPITQEKKPNKWSSTTSFRPFLNRLSRREFEDAATTAGFTIARRETHGFGGSRLRRSARALLPIPLLGQCFVSFYIYELAK